MISLILLLCVCASGALLARRLDLASGRLHEALALGAAMGLAMFAAFGFVLGWAFGLSTFTVLLAALLTMATGIGLGVRPSALGRRITTRPGTGAVLLSLLTLLLVARLSDRTLFETNTGIATGDRHNFGDLPFHMAIATGFAYGRNFPPEHPELAGVPLTYPFFGDLIAGMVLTLGGSWRDAFFWPSLILGLSVVVALVRFGQAVTGSRALGRAAAGLTFFSGGLGFLTLTDFHSLTRWWTGGPDLTINDAGVRYANVITTLFIPQRAILFGWPLLFFALALLIEGLKEDPPPDGRRSRTRPWLGAGIMASLLPLVHSHSFAVVCFCVLFFATLAGPKAFGAFVRGVLPLALPAVLFMASHNSLSAGKFLSWQPGFDGGDSEPIRYWAMNGGLFFPLAALGIARAPKASVRASLAAPFAVLFVLANLFRLSPWIWDNMKFMAPAHAGLAPFAALTLALLWKHGRIGKTLALLGFAVATLSGALDVSKVALSGGEYQIFDRTDLAFAEKVRQATDPGATILTAPTHNHPVLLSGRRVFLGYEGHLWSQGLSYAARKPVADALFRGEPPPEGAGALIRIDAIAVTPAEGPLIRDPHAFEGLPSLVESPYRLWQVR